MSEFRTVGRSEFQNERENIKGINEKDTVGDFLITFPFFGLQNLYFN